MSCITRVLTLLLLLLIELLPKTLVALGILYLIKHKGDFYGKHSFYNLPHPLVVHFNCFMESNLEGYRHLACRP